MKATKKDLKAVFDQPMGTIRHADWGGMTIEVADAREDMNAAPLFKGLPDDRCQCPHWGYVLKGRMRYTFADHEEVYSAGDFYYAPPGHTTLLEAGCEYVEFSPTDKLNETMAVAERNMKANK